MSSEKTERLKEFWESYSTAFKIAGISFVAGTFYGMITESKMLNSSYAKLLSKIPDPPALPEFDDEEFLDYLIEQRMKEKGLGN